MGDHLESDNAFDYEWSRYDEDTHRAGEDRLDDFLNRVGSGKEFLEGKRVLDAGCGMGRYSAAVAEVADEVVGIDLSADAIAAARETWDADNLEFRTGNLLEDVSDQVDGRFDLVYSFGVLHHTPAPRQGFDNITEVVRPGGTLAVFLYERENPVKEVLNDFLRFFTTRLDEETLWKLSHLLEPSNRVTKFIQSYANVLVYYPGNADQIFDWYSPQIQEKYKADEIRSWFEENGFEDIENTSPVQYTGLKKWIFGAHRGVIHMQGRKPEDS